MIQAEMQMPVEWKMGEKLIIAMNKMVLLDRGNDEDFSFPIILDGKEKGKGGNDCLAVEKGKNTEKCVCFSGW